MNPVLFSDTMTDERFGAPFNFGCNTSNFSSPSFDGEIDRFVIPHPEHEGTPTPIRAKDTRSGRGAGLHATNKAAKGIEAEDSATGHEGATGDRHRDIVHHDGFLPLFDGISITQDKIKVNGHFWM